MKKPRLRFKKGCLYQLTVNAIVGGGITLHELDVVPSNVLSNEMHPNSGGPSGAGYALHERTMLTGDQTLTYVGSSKAVVKYGDLLQPDFPMFIDNQSGLLITVRSLVVRTPWKYLRLLKI